MPCLATNAAGQPCEAPEGVIGSDGRCFAHSDAGHEHLATIAGLGGRALRAKLEGAAFTASDLSPMVTLEDAKLALDVIRVAVMTRRLTHNEGASAARAVDSWVKAEGAAGTGRLVNELRLELEAKTAEIAELRKHMQGTARPFKVSSR